MRLAASTYDPESPIVVTGSPPPPPPPPPYYPPPPPPPPHYVTDVNNMNEVTIGTHHIYYPKTMTADQTKALNFMINGIKSEDANLTKIGNNDTIKITETWTDSSGVQHSQTFAESGSDFKSQWEKASFAIVPDATYKADFNNSASTGGSSDVGSDPNAPGNYVVGFNLDQTVMGYYNSASGNTTDQSVLMSMLPLHEVAHDTIAGQAMYKAAGAENGDFTQGTPTQANENFANTLAMASLERMGLPIGDYTGADSLKAGWQPGDQWVTPSPTPTGGGGGYTGGGGGGQIP